MAIPVLELTAPPDSIDNVHGWLVWLWDGADDINAADRYRFELALIELTANVIRHADPGGTLTCTVEVNADDGLLEATVLDSGPLVDIDLENRSMPDALAESGRGIPLIHLLVDSLTYERVGDRNRWRIQRTTRSAPDRGIAESGGTRPVGL